MGGETLKVSGPWSPWSAVVAFGYLVGLNTEPWLQPLRRKYWAVWGWHRLLTGHQVEARFLLRVWPHLARQQGQLYWGPVDLWGFESGGHICYWASESFVSLSIK